MADTANDRIYVSDAGTSNLRIIENALLSLTDFNAITNNLKIVVNRNTDTLTIQANLSSNKKVNIKMFEITGKELFNKDYSVSDMAFSENIDRSSFESGIYIVLFAQDGVVISKKVVL